MSDYDPTADISQIGILNEALTPSWVLDKVESIYAPCWIWQGPRVKRHLGPTKDRAVARRFGKVTTATRQIWTEMRGPLPRHLLVRHICDQTMCVRPAHLTIGTHQDNSNDAIRRGTLRPGGRDVTQWNRLKRLDLSVNLPQSRSDLYSQGHATHPLSVVAMSPDVTG